MLALTSANSRLCRWNSWESCSPTATRTLSLVTAAVGMSNSMGLSDLASSLQTYCLEYNRASNRIYFNNYRPHVTLCLGTISMHNCCIVSLLTPLAAIYDVTTKWCRTPVFEILHSQKNKLSPFSYLCYCTFSHLLSIYQGCKTLSTRWCGWLNCVRWRLIFVSLQYRTCIMSPFWHPEFWGHSRIFGKFLYPWYKA